MVHSFPVLASKDLAGLTLSHSKTSLGKLLTSLNFKVLTVFSRLQVSVYQGYHLYRPAFPGFCFFPQCYTVTAILMPANQKNMEDPKVYCWLEPWICTSDKSRAHLGAQCSPRISPERIQYRVSFEFSPHWVCDGWSCLLSSNWLLPFLFLSQ